MENITPEQKKPVIKSLAIAGLVALLIFTAWIAIQIINVLPSAANSLASLASSVYNYSPNQARELTVESDQTLANINEPVLLTWTTPDIPGSIVFSYKCKLGVSVSISTAEKNFAGMTCDTAYNLGTVNAASVAISTMNERFTDVEYTVSFFRTNDTEASASSGGAITVVNAAVSTSTAAVITPEPAVTPLPEEEVLVATTTPEVLAPVIIEPVVEVVPAPKPIVRPSAPAPVYVPVYTYAIPVSNPNGTIDLAVSNLGLGTVLSNKQFSNSSLLRINQPGAIQFAVHNIGTKTSGPWTFFAILPGNLYYSSPTQTPLKPNERAVLTVEFPGVTNLSPVTYTVTVNTKNDAAPLNNTFIKSAPVYR